MWWSSDPNFSAGVSKSPVLQATSSKRCTTPWWMPSRQILNLWFSPWAEAEEFNRLWSWARVDTQKLRFCRWMTMQLSGQLFNLCEFCTAMCVVDTRIMFYFCFQIHHSFKLPLPSQRPKGPCRLRYLHLGQWLRLQAILAELYSSDPLEIAVFCARLGIHLDRLFKSAKLARLKLPFGESEAGCLDV